MSRNFPRKKGWNNFQPFFSSDEQTILVKSAKIQLAIPVRFGRRTPIVPHRLRLLRLALPGHANIGETCSEIDHGPETMVLQIVLDKSLTTSGSGATNPVPRYSPTAAQTSLCSRASRSSEMRRSSGGVRDRRVKADENMLPYSSRRRA